MTPAARVAAAIVVVDGWLAGRGGLDRALAAWGRVNRYAGSGDRRAIADLVYDAVRRLASATWVAGAEAPSGRTALLGSLILDGEDVEAIFSGSRFAPEPLDDAERARLGRVLAEAPTYIQADLPEWLAGQLSPEECAACTGLRSRAPLDLRVNLLKADLEGARAALAEEGVATVPGPLSPTCLRVREGVRLVARSRAYLEGLVEIQDAASQAVADYCLVRPGMRVLDFCAGGGGKALAFAAHLRGRGEVVAHDSSTDRLAQVPERAARAGAEITIFERGKLPDISGFDLVLVDAPCSGSGAWRRNPDAKWRLMPVALEQLTATQATVLEEASRFVSPGGRLVYATCSLFRVENQETVAAFLKKSSEYQKDREYISLDLTAGGDGFFAASLAQEPL